jgi:hypothetical protein
MSQNLTIGSLNRTVLRAMWHVLSRKIRFLDTSQVETTAQQVLAVHISIRANATLSDLCPSALPVVSGDRTIVSAASFMARKGPKLATCVYPNSFGSYNAMFTVWLVVCLMLIAKDQWPWPGWVANGEVTGVPAYCRDWFDAVRTCFARPPRAMRVAVPTVRDFDLMEDIAKKSCEWS